MNGEFQKSDGVDYRWCFFCFFVFLFFAHAPLPLPPSVPPSPFLLTSVQLSRGHCIEEHTKTTARDRLTTLAFPVITYSFNTINWKLFEIKKSDTKTRNLPALPKMHHPKADTNRLYLPRSEAERGLVQLELTYNTTSIGLEAHT